MKALAIAALVVLSVPATASAQYYQPYKPPVYGIPKSQPRTVYDYQSGNTYRATPNYDGSTTVRGNNMQNGTMWNSTIQPNGNQRGYDSNGNYWNYNQRSGAYYNSDGTTCYGKGAARTCN